MPKCSTPTAADTAQQTSGNLGGKFSDAAAMHGYSHSLDLCLAAAECAGVRRMRSAARSCVDEPLMGGLTGRL